MNREQQVLEFNKLMNQPVSDDPRIVPLELRQLGIKLIFEELKELAEASGCRATFNELCMDAQEKLTDSEFLTDSEEVNVVEQLDGLCDVAYTTSWAANVFGHGKYFQHAFDEVCRSNNSKACDTEEDAIATKEHWESPDVKEGGGEHFIDKVAVDSSGPGTPVWRYVVKRKEDGKVRKSIKYTPANLKQFVSHLK